jgi:SanA protein
MIRKWIKRTVVFGLIGLGIIAAMNASVEKYAKDKVFTDVNKIPSKKIGLLLGTSKQGQHGNPNRYYTYRINAALDLYKAGKIKYILVSGDNGNKGYDEPTNMHDDLIALGVPDSLIYLDYAGFSTMGSIVRCKKVFNENDITVISQKFHNERAIYLAQANGMTAIGYNAKDITGKYGLKTHLREYLARVKVHLDIWFDTQPKFLGDPIKIG